VAAAAHDELAGLVEGQTIFVTGLLHLEIVDYKGAKEIKSSRVLALKPDDGQAGRQWAETTDDAGGLPAWIRQKRISNDGNRISD
jgi:hypothetical protein